MFAITQITRLLPAVLLTVVAGVLSAPDAQAGSYTVTAVEVEATGVNGTEAREKAIKAGEKMAFDRLLAERITPEYRAHFATMPPQQISNMIQGFSVSNEKITGTTYRAAVNYTFSAPEIEGFIGASPAAAIRPQQQRSQAVVLPVFHSPEGLLLWEDTNPWRKAWEALGSSQFIMPQGDIQDISSAPPSSVSYARYTQLKPLAERYETREIAIAEASYKQDEQTGRKYLEVKLARLGPDLDDRSVSHYPVDPAVPESELMSGAAADVSQRMQTLPGTFAGKSGDSVVALVPLSSMKDWVEIRNRLQTSPEVEQVELAAISHMQADIRLHLRSSPESVAQAISSHGLRMTKENGYWVLRLGDH